MAKTLCMTLFDPLFLNGNTPELHLCWLYLKQLQQFQPLDQHFPLTDRQGIVRCNLAVDDHSNRRLGDWGERETKWWQFSEGQMGLKILKVKQRSSMV